MKNRKEQGLHLTNEDRLRGKDRKESYAAKPRRYDSLVQDTGGGYSEKTRRRARLASIPGVTFHSNIDDLSVVDGEQKMRKGRARRSTHKGRRESY